MASQPILPPVEPRLQKHPLHRWRAAWPPALLIFLSVTWLFYYWFAVADRYAVFLYGHLGETPFDARTSSRYWMSGLVAAGAVMLAYFAISPSPRIFSPMIWGYNSCC